MSSDSVARNLFICLGASNHATCSERETNDYYATDPKALELLLERETFAPKVWEPACGEGHLSEVLEAHGYQVRSTDLIDRGFGTGGVDFLAQTETWDGDIITNPPYRDAQKFAEHAYDIVSDGYKVALFLRLQFLEGKTRRKFFDKHPPKTVWVSSSRLLVARNGDFERYSSPTAMAFAWFIWEKGYTGAPIIKWFN